MSLKENIDSNSLDPPIWEPSVTHLNYSFTKKYAKYSNKFGWTCYYRCSKFRSGCDAVILHRHGAGTFEIANGNHTCPTALVEKRKMDPVFLKADGILDLTAEIKKKLNCYL